MSRLKCERKSFRSSREPFWHVVNLWTTVWPFVGASRGLLVAMICLSAVHASDAPTIVVSSLDDQGVVLLTSSHPSFAAAWQHGRAKGLDVVLPYTVVINNNSSREVIAYAVMWTCI